MRSRMHGAQLYHFLVIPILNDCTAQFSCCNIWILFSFSQEKYLIREKNAIEKTRRECEEIARREAERVHKLHQEDIQRCNERYNFVGHSKTVNEFVIRSEAFVLCHINILQIVWHLTDIWVTSWENLFMPYANNKCADQPAHPRNLISTFVVRCLDSIIPLLAKSKISRL